MFKNAINSMGDRIEIHVFYIYVSTEMFKCSHSFTWLESIGVYETTFRIENVSWRYIELNFSNN